MSQAKGQLFEPSLINPSQSVRPVYSSRTAFLVAFFGGPFAMLLFWAQTSNAAERLRRERWLLLALGAATLSVTLVPLALSVSELRSSFVYRYAPKVLSLVFWLLYLRSYRAQYACMDLAGTPPAPARTAVIVSLAGAVVLSGSIGLLVILVGTLS